MTTRIVSPSHIPATATMCVPAFILCRTHNPSLTYTDCVQIATPTPRAPLYIVWLCVFEQRTLYLGSAVVDHNLAPSLVVIQSLQG